MALHHVNGHSSIPALPKDMCGFSEEMKIYQPKADQPILIGRLKKKHQEWLMDQEEIIFYESVFVEYSRFMISNWNGMVDKIIFPSMDLLVMFVLTFR